MTVFSQLPLQQAIYDTLTGDATLMGMVTGIYDRPPQGSAFPYITLGDTDVADWSTKTTAGTEHRSTLHAWSREGGRAQAAAIMERLHTLLHQGTMIVPGQSMVSCRFLSSSLVLENDGWTYHGAVHFRARLEAIS